MRRLFLSATLAALAASLPARAGVITHASADSVLSDVELTGPLSAELNDTIQGIQNGLIGSVTTFRLFVRPSGSVGAGSFDLNVLALDAPTVHQVLVEVHTRRIGLGGIADLRFTVPVVSGSGFLHLDLPVGEPVNGNTGTLFVTVSAVPEPPAAALAALGLPALALVRRRRAATASNPRPSRPPARSAGRPRCRRS